MPTTKEPDQVKQRIRKIRECYRMGHEILKQCPPYSASEGLLEFAAKHRINRETVTKYRAMAMPETGYTEEELAESIESFHKEGRALTINHFVRLLSVPKKTKRKELEQKALQGKWSLRRLQQEILAVNGRRYEASGRKPRIPQSKKSAVAAVAHQIWSWQNWLDAYLGNPVSDKTPQLKTQLRQLSDQMQDVYNSIATKLKDSDVRRKKGIDMKPAVT